MRHETRLTLRYSSSDRAHRVERAVSPELDSIDDDRSRTQLDRADETLTLVVEAADLVALRAGLNTWLSLVSVAEQAGDVC